MTGGGRENGKIMKSAKNAKRRSSFVTSENPWRSSPHVSHRCKTFPQECRGFSVDNWIIHCTSATCLQGEWECSMNQRCNFGEVFNAMIKENTEEKKKKKENVTSAAIIFDSAGPAEVDETSRLFFLLLLAIFCQFASDTRPKREKKNDMTSGAVKKRRLMSFSCCLKFTFGKWMNESCNRLWCWARVRINSLCLWFTFVRKCGTPWNVSVLKCQALIRACFVKVFWNETKKMQKTNGNL